MSLAAKVQARYSVQLLANLTNPQNTGGTTLDSARLSAACADVEAEFAIYTGATYDDADARSVTIAVEGVVEKLRIYTGQVGAMESHGRWLERLRALAKVTGRDRIIPKTTSPVVTTTDTVIPGQTPTPDFDRPMYDHLIPEGPGASAPYVSP